ncbi:hypothetical protein [Jiangella gansuensis]|uniref:hypothetical protein n=1 Tax=Jiangella gansuensis TaxID=281473 RepID=UPI0004BCB0D2|nr:hypothetical protein [Jiangella gansuensis]
MPLELVVTLTISITPHFATNSSFHGLTRSRNGTLTTKRSTPVTRNVIPDSLNRSGGGRRSLFGAAAVSVYAATNFSSSIS